MDATVTCTNCDSVHRRQTAGKIVGDFVARCPCGGDLRIAEFETLDYEVVACRPVPCTIAAFGSPVDADGFAAKVSKDAPDTVYVVTDSRGDKKAFLDGRHLEAVPGEATD